MKKLSILAFILTFGLFAEGAFAQALSIKSKSSTPKQNSLLTKLKSFDGAGKTCNSTLTCSALAKEVQAITSKPLPLPNPVNVVNGCTHVVRGEGCGYSYMHHYVVCWGYTFDLGCQENPSHTFITY